MVQNLVKRPLLAAREAGQSSYHPGQAHVLLEVLFKWTKERNGSGEHECLLRLHSNGRRKGNVVRFKVTEMGKKTRCPRDLLQLLVKRLKRGDSGGLHKEKEFDLCTSIQPIIGLHWPFRENVSPEIRFSEFVFTTFLKIIIRACLFELDHVNVLTLSIHIYICFRIKENSIYLRLRKRNRCNHRDYQNLSKNGE